jgi:antitoxin MazE
MKAKVSKWGNSLAVRLPKALVDVLALAEGDELEFVKARNKIVELFKCDARERALVRMALRNWKLPKGYKFDREEANRRR